MKRRQRILDDEEARLWASVARQVRPLPGRRVPGVPEAAPGAVPTEAGARTPERPGLREVPAVPRPAGPPSKPAKPPLHPIERPVRRKLAKGRLAIDDRIDLHDRTESLAHYALLGFLRHSRQQGLRHVLVITGRGSSPGSVGALKRALPHWFDTAEFRALVAGFEPAARGHGGEGAFYVRLRRR